jgi:aminopeptidase 2
MSSATITKPLNEYRLPLDVKPTHYDVTIRTDLEKLSFGGFVKIDLDIKKETSTIVFNSVDLKLSDVSIYSFASKTHQVQAARTFDTTMGRATVHFPTALPAGSKAQLQIGFEGDLTSNMQGYYKSGWEHEGKTKYYALTQFEVSSSSIDLYF